MYTDPTGELFGGEGGGGFFGALFFFANAIFGNHDTPNYGGNGDLSDPTSNLSISNNGSKNASIQAHEPNPNYTFDSPSLQYNPIFGYDGNFLGVDNKGYSGDILIMDANTYKNLVNDFGGESGVLDHNIATQFDKGLSSITDFEAMSNIQTHVLAEKGFDISKLHNGKISISSGFSRGGITQGFNNPIPNTGRHKTKIMKDGKINVTTRSFSELGSVEMIVNYLGVHEFTGHGVEQWNNGYDHYKAYELQKKHKSFHSLESYYQEEIKSRFNDPVNRPDGYRPPYGWKRY